MIVGIDLNFLLVYVIEVGRTPHKWVSSLFLQLPQRPTPDGGVSFFPSGLLLTFSSALRRRFFDQFLPSLLFSFPSRVVFELQGPFPLSRPSLLESSQQTDNLPLLETSPPGCPPPLFPGLWRQFFLFNALPPSLFDSRLVVPQTLRSGRPRRSSHPS